MAKKASVWVWCRVCMNRQGHEHVVDDTYRCLRCGELNSTVPAQIAVQRVAEKYVGHNRIINRRKIK